MTGIFYFLSISAFHASFFAICFAKPAQVLPSPDSLNPALSEASKFLTSDTEKKRRSPQFGLLNDYGVDYSDYDDDVGNYKLGYKHKPHKFPQKPFRPLGGYGCQGYGCGGGYPGGYYPQGGHEGYYPHGGHGGSFASATAGTIGQGGGPFGGHSQANSQSASFSLGPYMATFSVSHASSGRSKGS